MTRQRLVSPAAALVLLLALAVAVETVAARKLTQGDQPAEELQPVVDNEDPFDDRYAMAEDELIVKFKAGATEVQKGKALGKGNAAEKRQLRGDKETGDISLVKVKFSQGQSSRAQLKAQAAKIQADEDVEYAEPNFVYKASQTNDQYTNVLWGMLPDLAGANAVGAWNKGYTDCSDVVIGVIDEGIQFNHPDLAAHMWVNPGEMNAAASDGIDNDGNGKVDDVYGWDFYWGDSSVYNTNEDTHGTHVAGTIGAVGNNGQGVVGVCQSGVKMISAKFLGPQGGTLDGAIAAMYYLLDLKKRYNLNMVATSNSWGGGGYAQSLYNVIAEHRANGILFIAAAGNAANNNDAFLDYPSSYNLDSVISVGAIDKNGVVASFSNYGATTVDLFAPGVDIASTYPVNSYVYLSGTSMATPMVSGAVALFAAAYKQYHGSNPTLATIKAAVMDGIPDTRYTGKCVSGARLNIARLLDSVIAPPPPPPPPPAVRKMYVQFSTMRVNRVSTSRSSLTVTLTVRDSLTNTAIPGASLSSSWTINPDHPCTDVTARFPQAVAGTLTSGAGSTTSPPFQTKTSATKCIKSQIPGFAGSQITHTIISVSASGYELDTTRPMSVVSAVL